MSHTANYKWKSIDQLGAGTFGRVYKVSFSIQTDKSGINNKKDRKRKRKRHFYRVIHLILYFQLLTIEMRSVFSISK